MVRLSHCTLALLLLALLVPANARAQARFDLDGPKIDIHVTRAGVSLPIAAVPNLQPGDQIWLHPDLPPTQSVHYLLIAVFLRGTTNPPPENWFTRIETWQRKVREEGVSVTVPEGAQQAVLFLAPETGGDFGTLRSAVQGRPGIFVRASQDLNEAGFEQSRIDAYLDAMKRVANADPAEIQLHSNLLARTLNLRPNPDCLKRPLDQQYNCLTQSGAQTLLDDGHAQSVVSALSTGPNSDFINTASATQLAGGGTYSAYVGAIVDFVHILSTLHTAVYQYIPALATPKNDALNLRLNTPPSFHNPKSVIVIGLPAIQKAVPPPLRPADPNHISCLLDPSLILPVEGAPLVFSTAFAHQLVLHITPQSGAPEDIPLLPDAYGGGLTLAPTQPTRHELPTVPVPNLGTQPKAQTPAPAPDPKPVQPGQPTTGTIQGIWGFDPFTGPTVALQQTPGTGWHIVNPQDTILIAGKPNHLQLQSSGTACIQSITLEPSKAPIAYQVAESQPVATPEGKPEATPKPEPKPDPKPEPKPDPKPEAATQPKPANKFEVEPMPKPPALLDLKPQPVDLTLNLQHDATPGSLRLAILQFGQKDPDQLGAQTFAEPAKIDSLAIHAGDRTALLTGTALDQVASLTTQEKNLTYAPAPSSTTPDSAKTIELALAADTKGPTFKASDKVSAQVHLKDGRKLDVSTTILPARPIVTLLSRRATDAPASPIQLTTPNDLPLGAQLHFFLKSKESFPRSEQIEIASADPESYPALHTTLSIAAGTLILQDSHTVLATFDPLKLFGPSTFGPFRLRALSADNTAGEWLPLVTIVRLPTLTTLTCPPIPPNPCRPIEIRTPQNPTTRPTRHTPDLHPHRRQPLPYRRHSPHRSLRHLHARPRGLRRLHAPHPPPPNPHLLSQAPRRPRHHPDRHPPPHPSQVASRTIRFTCFA